MVCDCWDWCGRMVDGYGSEGEYQGSVLEPMTSRWRRKAS